MDELNQPKKSFFRRFWWVGLILIVIIGTLLIILRINNNGGGKFGQKADLSSELKTLSMSKDISVCPADGSPIFTKAFMDSEKPDYIVPLGNSNESGHVVPVDHVYPIINEYEEKVPIYAPGNMTLIWVENKQLYNSNTNEKIRPDFQLNFAPCRGVNLAFIHIKTLSEKLQNAIIDEIDSNCDTSQKMDYGIQEGVPAYYVTCHPELNHIKIEAGELLGYFGGNKDKPQQGFDIGFYNYNLPMVGFANPARYYTETNYTACFADYYTPELKAKYNAKFGTMEYGQSNTQKTFQQRIIEPVCGKVMYDVIGTASGDWFKNPVNKNNATDNDAMVLMHDNLKPLMAKFTIANVTSFTFDPTHGGNINREFSEVTADNKVYCYQDDNTFSGSDKDKNGDLIVQDRFKYLIQLVDDTHIKSESQSGVCGSNEIFKSPTIYER